MELAISQLNSQGTAHIKQTDESMALLPWCCESERIMWDKELTFVYRKIEPCEVHCTVGVVRAVTLFQIFHTVIRYSRYF